MDTNADSLKITINANPEDVFYIRYAWQLFARHIHLLYDEVTDGSAIRIGVEGTDCEIQISKKLLANLAGKKYHHRHYFTEQPLIFNENGFPDYLGTAFYMINCVQEYDRNAFDEYGRFPYSASYQAQYNCAGENLVADYFKKLSQTVPLLRDKIPASKPLTVFLSHDNDSFYGSFLQDGLYAMKKGRLDIVLRLVFNEIIRRPAWFNIDRIMDIEDAFDVKSAFFWLVTKNKTNADYAIDNPRVRRTIDSIEKRGFENGLHKSIAATNFDEEAKLIGKKVTGNRNHFLKMRLPDHYRNLEKSGFKLDSSLGFAEMIGFRNNYGLPFRPFDIEQKREFDLVEVPLNIMDTTFFHYLNLPVTQVKNHCLDFLEKNKADSIITILWHNNFFTGYKFKGYLEAYKTILSWMRDNKIRSVSQQEIIWQYGL